MEAKTSRMDLWHPSPGGHQRSVVTSTSYLQSSIYPAQKQQGILKSRIQKMLGNILKKTSLFKPI